MIYRRIDDDFLDPEVFAPNSLLGVPGIMRAYKKGNLGLANAIGTGVADDKAVYAYMPRIIKYYLDQEPILANVETHICREAHALKYTLANLDKLVVKPVGEAGGYGITVGPRASKAELETCREDLLADPDNYVSQPMVKLSVCPTLVDGGVGPRHVDLRPFAVTGKSTFVGAGGSTSERSEQFEAVVLRGTVHFQDAPRTLYALAGDWLQVLAILNGLVLIGAYRETRRGFKIRPEVRR